MSQMVTYEPCIDKNISLLIEQLRKKFVPTGKPLDIMDWFTFWSLETIYDLTFGERMGYIEEGKDVNNLISGVRETMSWTLYVCPLYTQPLCPNLTQTAHPSNNNRLHPHQKPHSAVSQ